MTMAGEPRRDDPGIPLPAPSAAPMLFALGLGLLFAGLVTQAIVSAVGAALALVGAVGWWRAVLPQQRYERVALQPVAERPPPILPQPDRLEHLRAGEDRHRVRIPAQIQPYSSGLLGGAAGALSMALVAMTWGLIAERSPWLPINLLASAVLPALNAADLEQLRGFDATALGVATLMHGGLSLLVGLVYAALLPTLPGRVLIWGGLVAPVVWSGVAWVSLGVVAPALSEHIRWGWFIVSQVAFGLTAGAVIARAQPIETLQTWPLAARAGIEVSRGPGDDDR